MGIPPSERDLHHEKESVAKPRVLVAEDDAAVALTFEKLFKEEATAEIVSSGEEAIERLTTEGYIPYDLLIIDYGLSGKSTGFDVAQEFKQHSPTTYVLLLTGNRDIVRSHTTQQLAEIGIRKVIEKPFSVMDIFDLLETISSEKQLRETSA